MSNYLDICLLEQIVEAEARPRCKIDLRRRCPEKAVIDRRFLIFEGLVNYAVILRRGGQAAF